MSTPISLAVVIPCYRVRASIQRVLQRIPPEVERIYVVDDACPEKSGEFVRNNCRDPRITVVSHRRNQGVGGAVMSGYREALRDGAEYVIKIDGDGQMDPALLWRFAAPLREGHADYVKGNRFYRLESLAQMPALRLFGNAALSFITKASTGYWDLMDPTNGYTAIDTRVLRMLPLEKIDRRYFFESDMLFRLGTIRAVVHEVPMDALYPGEVGSSLRVGRSVGEFALKHLNRLGKRIFYTYFLRDFTVGSIHLVVGAILLMSGLLFGAYSWYLASHHGVTASTGTVMLAALPVIFGFQLLLAAVSGDVANVPREPVSRTIGMRRGDGAGRVRTWTEAKARIRARTGDDESAQS